MLTPPPHLLQQQQQLQQQQMQPGATAGPTGPQPPLPGQVMMPPGAGAGMEGGMMGTPPAVMHHALAAQQHMGPGPGVPLPPPPQPGAGATPPFKQPPPGYAPLAPSPGLGAPGGAMPPPFMQQQQQQQQQPGMLAPGGPSPSPQRPPQQQQQQQQRAPGGAPLPAWAQPGAPVGPSPGGAGAGAPLTPNPQLQPGFGSGYQPAGAGGDAPGAAPAAGSVAGDRGVAPALLVQRLRHSGSAWMSADDINYVLRIQHMSTHSGLPYLEDHYYQVRRVRARAPVLWCCLVCLAAARRLAARTNSRQAAWTQAPQHTLHLRSLPPNTHTHTPIPSPCPPPAAGVPEQVPGRAQRRHLCAAAAAQLCGRRRRAARRGRAALC
jgi:hypothetical protein